MVRRKIRSKASYVCTHYICYNLAAKSKDEVVTQAPPKKEGKRGGKTWDEDKLEEKRPL